MVLWSNSPLDFLDVSSLQNRCNFLCISGELRQKQGKRKVRVACEGITSVLQAKMYHTGFYDRIKTLFTICKYLHLWLVPEIFKFEKSVKHANEMNDDVIHSTQYYIKYINRAILANLQHISLKLGRLLVLQETPTAIKNMVPMATHSFPVPTHWSSIC